jgi:hypothetical protein
MRRIRLKKIFWVWKIPFFSKNIPKFRKALSRFRCSAQRLVIEEDLGILIAIREFV